MRTLSPQAIIEALSPFVLPQRLERLRTILAQRTRHLIPVCEHFYDPHNVAACTRTAEALGLQELHIIPCPPRDKPASRQPRDPSETMPEAFGRSVNMRADQWLEVQEHGDSAQAIAHLKARGYAIAVTALDHQEKAFHPAQVSLDRPLAVFFGNENAGLSASTIAAADYHVLWPLRGFTQSFNVSVACALLMGHLRERLENETLTKPHQLDSTDYDTVLARWLQHSVTHAEAILQRYLKDSAPY